MSVRLARLAHLNHFDSERGRAVTLQRVASEVLLGRSSSHGNLIAFLAM